MSHQQVGARICKFELSGESNIYVCPRDEYCCNIGCCISPTFQFYQLWYYWFIVFFLFLVCSGGQWWYKYMMQSRCSSAMPPPNRRISYPRQCRVAYTPARDTVVLHHLWKPSYTGMSGAPPAYSQTVPPGSSVGGTGPKPSPYMQLYGPPPSYESVIGAGPAPVHHLATNGGGNFDMPTSGSSQLNPEGASQNIQLPTNVNIVGPQQHFKQTLPGHHRHLSVGANSVGPRNLAASSSSQSNIEGVNQDLQIGAGVSGHQYHKPGHHHRPLSLGANASHFDFPPTGSSHPNISGTTPDLQLALSVAGNGHQHFKQPHHHRQLSAGHNSSSNNHHQHGEYSHPRQSSAHLHHYHQHHVHHRQSSHPAGLERTSAGGGIESLSGQEEKGECQFVPPPPLQDDEMEREDRVAVEQAPATPLAHPTANLPPSLPQQP